VTKAELIKLNDDLKRRNEALRINLRNAWDRADAAERERDDMAVMVKALFDADEMMKCAN